MKIFSFLLFTFVLLAGNTAFAEEITIGTKASDWSFTDADDKAFTMKSWPDKVLLITYNDPDESDLNEHFMDATKKAKDDGLLKSETYQEVAIADCEATWKPNTAIRTIAGGKAKKYNMLILFDLDASLRKSWGLKEDSANVILLDKNRTVKYISRGKVDDAQIASVVQKAIDLQTRSDEK
ncbi:MAG: hypothetical protein JZU65_02085 [Chlorobium sp.]|jgi:predicted transcriptional regulator|nr:hypothetical protein [Chlorobium sp.]